MTDPAADPASTKTEPVKTEPVKVEPAKVEPAKTDSSPVSSVVTVKTPKEVLVEQRDSASAPWRHVCASPCSFVPKGGQYRVIGVDVSPSEPFVLKAGGPLDVTIGSAPLARRGMWITGAAAGAVTLGLIFIFSSAGFSDLSGQGPDGKLRDDKIGVLTTGSIFMLGGLAAGIYGGAMLYDNRRSRVGGPTIGDTRQPSVGLLSPFALTF